MHVYQNARKRSSTHKQRYTLSRLAKAHTFHLRIIDDHYSTQDVDAKVCNHQRVYQSSFALLKQRQQQRQAPQLLSRTHEINA